jgi:hypothetical protein
VSGFYWVPRTFPWVAGGHQAMPEKGTWYREGNRSPADLLNRGDYPVVAECMTCHKPIRLAVFEQMEWVHVPAMEEGSARNAERRRDAPVPEPPKDKAMTSDEDFTQLSDPVFLAERRRVRELLERTPEHEVSASLADRYERLTDEFLRRARLAWTQVS